MPLNLFVVLSQQKAVLIWGCFLVFFIQNVMAQETRFVLDRRLHATAPRDQFWYTASQASYPLAIGTPLVQLGLGYGSKNKEWVKEGWQSLAGVALSAGMGFALKETIQRERPFLTDPTIIPYKIESGYSFPSGSTTLAFTWATQLSLSVPKWYVVVPAYAIAGGIGYSRIALGAHYPTDVVAGAALGTGSAFLSRWLTKKIRYTN